jgi:hypothetical protein
MSLSLTYNGMGECCPHLTCDWCNSAITNARGALVAWPSAETQPLVMLHKGPCDLQYESQHGHHSWMGIESLLSFVSHNAGVRNAQPRRRKGRQP